MAQSTSSYATYFPLESFLSFSSPRKHTRVLSLSPQRPREATTQTAAVISGPSCRHVCSAVYLFKPAAGSGGPAQASPGAWPACLRIHSHLRIKLLTLMLPVMLGLAPIYEPIKWQELGNIEHTGKGGRKEKEWADSEGGVLLDKHKSVVSFFKLHRCFFFLGCMFAVLMR